MSTPAVRRSLWRCCYSPGMEFSVWSLLLPLSEGRQGSRIERVRASKDLRSRPTRDARSWRRNVMIAGGNGARGLEEQSRVTPPGTTAVLGLALCQALLGWRVPSGGTSTTVRAGTKCESELSNVTTTSCSCHLQVPFAPCQRVDAGSKSTRLPRGPSGCSVASVTASGMMLTRGGAARSRWTISLRQ